MEQQTVSIKRTGTGVHDWELSLSDGSTLPPIKSISLNVVANQLPTLLLEVEDAFMFEGSALPAAWRVSLETLAAMATDHDYELLRAGLFDETDKALQRSRADYAELTVSHLGLAGDLATEKANVAALSALLDKAVAELAKVREEKDSLSQRQKTLIQQCEVAAQRYDRDGEVMGTLTRKVGEFRENNIRLAKELDALKAERSALFFDNGVLRGERDRAHRSAELARSVAASRDWHAPSAAVLNAQTESVQASADNADLSAKVRELQALVDAGKIDQQRALDAEAIARRYEEENHALKRELKGLPPLKGAPVVADLPDAPPPPSILVLAHDDEQCRRLRNASKGRYKVMSVGQSLYGHRYNTIIVAEVPQYLAQLQGAYADRRRNVLSRVLIEDLPCRLNIGGVLINLND